MSCAMMPPPAPARPLIRASDIAAAAAAPPPPPPLSRENDRWGGGWGPLPFFFSRENGGKRVFRLEREKRGLILSVSLDVAEQTTHAVGAMAMGIRRATPSPPVSFFGVSVFVPFKEADGAPAGNDGSAPPGFGIHPFSYSFSWGGAVGGSEEKKKEEFFAGIKEFFLLAATGQRSNLRCCRCCRLPKGGNDASLATGSPSYDRSVMKT